MVNLTRSQRRGLLVLVVVLIVLIGWKWRSSQVAPNATPTENTPSADKAAKVELNSADTSLLQTVQGIGPVLARRIVRYRTLIGGFKSTDQLLGVYGLSPENLVRIEEQVFVDTTGPAFAALRAGRPRNGSHRLPSRIYEFSSNSSSELSEGPSTSPFQSTTNNTSPSSSNPRTSMVLDLNLADSTDLVEVPGIGPATARNIVKYRGLIFHFHSLDQLTEVWGLRPENLERMRPHLKVGNNLDNLPHIHINKMTVDEMGKHKYLGYKAARIIVNYRDKHGPFNGVPDLLAVNELGPELVAKLEPYLVF